MLARAFPLFFLCFGAFLIITRPSVAQTLTLVEIHEDNESGEANGTTIEQTHLDVFASGGSEIAAMSPDGAHVYVASSSDDALTVFSRNSSTGALTLVEIHEDNESPETNGEMITSIKDTGVSRSAASRA